MNRGTEMFSLRFPFSFSPSRKNFDPITRATASRKFAATALSVAVAAGAAAFAGGVAASLSADKPKGQFLQDVLDSLSSKHSSPLWGSLSLADSSSPVVESKTGASFPPVISDSRKLLGVGLRRKKLLGLKNIDVYAFGVYVDHADVKNLLGEKYGKLSGSELKENKEFNTDLFEKDICMTVRLQIVYSRLSISSVRSAFEESVGSRLQKFGGSDNKDLLQRFTSLFKDEYKIPRGSVIELSRERGHVLHTTIDGKDVGRLPSKLLCRSILDLYIGEDPFDRKAKADIEQALVSLVHEPYHP